jgi:TfoX/Sxy family transcriptional regulator of competence genes
MATSQETIDYILDRMSGERVSARKMFGEYALYCDGRVIALVCDDTLFMKITDQGKEFAGAEYREGIAYPGAKPSMQISEDTLENREWLTELVRITTANVPLPKPKKLKKK